MTNRILRRRDVEALCGIARSTIYAWMDTGQFPRPVSLGGKAVGWREGDVAAWLESRTQKAA